MRSCGARSSLLIRARRRPVCGGGGGCRGVRAFFIGRGSGWGRGEISGGAVLFKKKKKKMGGRLICKKKMYERVKKCEIDHRCYTKCKLDSANINVIMLLSIITLGCEYFTYAVVC